MSSVNSDITKSIINDSSSSKFIVATIIGLGFALAVILSTMGLMDGFEKKLKSSLGRASGDLVITNRKGYFKFLDSQEKLLEKKFKLSFSKVIKTEGFITGKYGAHGIVLMGIDDVYSSITSLSIPELKKEEVIIGSALAKKLNIKRNDFVQVSLISGKDLMPRIFNFKIKDIISHDVHNKDMRYLYVSQEMLKDDFDLKDDVYNHIIVKNNSINSISKIKNNLLFVLGETFYIREFWEEYTSLIKSVKSEKISILAILQIIVIVSIFNVAAFILYIMDKKNREFFLFRCLGVQYKFIKKFWYLTVSKIWILSCVLSLLLVYLFNFILMNTNLFLLPGDVYVLSRFSLSLSAIEVMSVFILALLWMYVLSYFSLKRMEKKSLISGLREDLS